jgi:hypothetical protein
MQAKIGIPYGSWYGPHPDGADRVDMVDGAALNHVVFAIWGAGVFRLRPLGRGAAALVAQAMMWLGGTDQTRS